MDEKLKNDAKKVMLVQDANSGQLKAVTDVDKDGNIQTVEPPKANLASLLNVNTMESRLRQKAGCNGKTRRREQIYSLFYLPALSRTCAWLI